MTRNATSVCVVVAMCAAGGATLRPEPLAVRTVAAAQADETVTIDGEKYPNPLRMNDGTAVTAAQWGNSRRAELLADFRQNVYGQSLPTPTAQTFEVTPTDFPGVTRKKITITVTGPQGTGGFAVDLFVPKTGGKPRGTFLLIDHRGQVGDDPGQTSGYAPISTITEAGYAFATFDAGQVAPDDSGSYRSGMINLFHPSDRELPDDAGRTISAWAWGASRAMDYLQTDPDIDPTKVAVIGHSRSGKAALWAGAQDTRFAAVITNDSGSTGTKLARRGDGGVGAETVARINDSFPHWFPQTYKAYDDRVDSLPVDQHELLALVAPRRIVVASATDDANADPEGEFLSYLAAAPVYQLYGLGDTGLPSTTWPPATDQGFRGPAMSYHLRSGGHGLTATDWGIYLKGDLFSRDAGAPGAR
ncbi:acetylxylan esterase [Pseudonocardia sp. RS11V-5]|uniref:glucuronyl esterase domain-containing protein n=1 Tax=Pseudonocardia terrae TaxID=2905831 RepID=UPI001E2BE5F0|nr:acetylxylan esterase [Pseudonocardia terrae]MCE3549864.1 acetylxylan esterase [Pseudonocardia terrae]